MGVGKYQKNAEAEDMTEKVIAQVRIKNTDAWRSF